MTDRQRYCLRRMTIADSHYTELVEGRHLPFGADSSVPVVDPHSLWRDVHECVYYDAGADDFDILKVNGEC